MKCFVFLLVLSVAVVCASYSLAEKQVYWDIQGDSLIDLTDAFTALCQVSGIEQLVTLSIDSHFGSEYVLALTIDEAIIIDPNCAWRIVARFPRQDLLALFGLSDSAICDFSYVYKQDPFLVLHSTDSEYPYYLQLGTGDISRDYFPPDNSDFYTSIGLSDAQLGLLYRSQSSGEWVWKPELTREFSFDFEAKWGFTPRTMSLFQLKCSEDVYGMFMSVRDATPTPTLTPTPRWPLQAVIVNGLGETVSTITRNHPRHIDNRAALTGIGPNQVMQYGDEVYVVNSLSNSIQVLSLPNLRTVREISLPNAANPFWMDILDDERAYVTNFLRESVTVFDPLSGQVTGEIALPTGDDLPKDVGVVRTMTGPEGIVCAGGKVFVACTNLANSATAGGPGIIAIIDPESATLETWFQTTGRNTVSVAYDGVEKVYISNAGDYDGVNGGYLGNGSVDVYSLIAHNIVSTIKTGGAPFEIVIAPNGLIYIADGQMGRIMVVDKLTEQLLPAIDIPTTERFSYTSGLAIDRTGNLFALEFNGDKLFVIDTSSNQIIENGYLVGDGPDGICVVE